MRDQPTSTATMTSDPPPGARRHSSEKDNDHLPSHKKMAAQSQGIKQLMAAEKEAAQVVANARKSKNDTKMDTTVPWGRPCHLEHTSRCRRNHSSSARRVSSWGKFSSRVVDGQSTKEQEIMSLIVKAM